MSTVFIQGCIGSIFVSQTQHNHIRSTATDDEVPTAINCPECEPYLVRDFFGVYSKDQVPPTTRQIEARERAQEAGNSAVSEAAKALAATATANMRRSPDDADIDRRIAAAVAQALSQKPATGV